MVEPTPDGQIRTASGLNFLVGLWQILSPWVLAYSGEVAATTNAVVVGLIVALFAATRYLGAYGAAWMSWVNAALGVWLIVSPWLLAYSDVPSATMNSVVVGILMAALGTWSALSTPTTLAR